MSERVRPDRLFWIGRSASALVIVALPLDASVQFFVPDLAAGMLGEAGFETTIAPVLGMIMLACVILYAIPATSFLGAILITGFLGGAICAHLRLGEIGSPPELLSLLLGLLAWGGLYLRDPRLRDLLPIRR
ncbi:DoxX family protein [Martelella endophytica]|uniref:Membrane protein n=1 Tax=Martelella endophytica TaxID=1486262 RepID=A0A0D5LRX8_MAREN|nr:DoxX family protein [Martelella endophytica]AJY46527.1 membrane protein [Martelella endophytica]